MLAHGGTAGIGMLTACSVRRQVQQRLPPSARSPITEPRCPWERRSA